MGLESNPSFQPCNYFIQSDNVLRVNDTVFLEMLKNFQKIEYFFRDNQNCDFLTIHIDKIAIQPGNLAPTAATSDFHKSIQMKENESANDSHCNITLDFETWQQLVQLRDILCLKLTLLRKYRVCVKTIFDQLVNHLATSDSSEVDMLQLPTNMI